MEDNLKHQENTIQNKPIEPIENQENSQFLSLLASFLPLLCIFPFSLFEAEFIFSFSLSLFVELFKSFDVSLFVLYHFEIHFALLYLFLHC